MTACGTFRKHIAHWMAIIWLNYHLSFCMLLSDMCCFGTSLYVAAYLPLILLEQQQKDAPLPRSRLIWGGFERIQMNSLSCNTVELLVIVHVAAVSPIGTDGHKSSSCIISQGRGNCYSLSIGNCLWVWHLTSSLSCVCLRNQADKAASSSLPTVLFEFYKPVYSIVSTLMTIWICNYHQDINFEYLEIAK